MTSSVLVPMEPVEPSTTTRRGTRGGERLSRKRHPAALPYLAQCGYGDSRHRFSRCFLRESAFVRHRFQLVAAQLDVDWLPGSIDTDTVDFGSARPQRAAEFHDPCSRIPGEDDADIIPELELRDNFLLRHRHALRPIADAHHGLRLSTRKSELYKIASSEEANPLHDARHACSSGSVSGPAAAVGVPWWAATLRHLFSRPRSVMRAGLAGSATARSRVKPNRSKSSLMASTVGLPWSSFLWAVRCAGLGAGAPVEVLKE